jgi:hypothetical protein
MFEREARTVVKATSVALSVAFAVTGLTGLGALSIGNARLCYGDFIPHCDPIEAPTLTLITLASAAMIAFLFFARVSNSSRRLRQSIAESQQPGARS